MSDFFLFTISTAVTVLGLVGSWAAARKRGMASGLRGAAWSLVPLGAYLTGLTKFLSDLVFSPVKWAGVIVLAFGGVLYLTSGVMLRKGAGASSVDSGAKRPEGAPKSAPAGGTPKAVEKRQQGVDPDLADIEQILKNRGIS
jgi:threonine/homoserine/homoserine lactone efflux protein